MFSSFSSFSSIQNTYINPVTVTTSTLAISAITGVTSAKDTSPYIISNKTVYSFKSTIAQPITTSQTYPDAQNNTGTFTITVTSQPTIINYIIVAGGGGGGGSNGQGCGGGGGGEVKQGSIPLPIGTYICSCSIGGGGGCTKNGGPSSLSINGTNYTTIGGAAGAGADTSNLIAGAYGGGAGGIYRAVSSFTGSTGSVLSEGVYYKGGNSSTTPYVNWYVCSGGGGGGARGSGADGTYSIDLAIFSIIDNVVVLKETGLGITTSTKASSNPGGIGGNGISSNTFIPALQFTTPQYFSAGGGGGAFGNYGGTAPIPRTVSTNNIGGMGGGSSTPYFEGEPANTFTHTNYNCTGGVNNTGSGGGGMGTPWYGAISNTVWNGAPGANGIIILSF